MMRLYLNLLLLLALCLHARGQAHDSLLAQATLENCVDYAFVHHPVLQRTVLDEKIAEEQIRVRLSDWFPQINFNYNIQHNFQRQTTIIGGSPVQLGVDNSSYGQFGLNQAIFNRDVLLASKSADDVRALAKQTTASTRIDVKVNVSKAFYGVLLTRLQIRLDDQTIARVEGSYKNAFDQYKGGVADKIDYKRALIALNAAKSDRKKHGELLVARYAELKQQMGYPSGAELDLQYDSTQLLRDAFIDTTQRVDVTGRIEYQLLQTQKRLQADNLSYYKWGFLPSVSAFANYNFNYLSNDFGKLYGNNFPNSYAGLSLAIPIFQGTRRVHDVRQATLQLKRVDYDLADLDNSVHSSFANAMSVYKAYLESFRYLHENVGMANDVYNTIQLQYKSGVKTYLDVVVAESDLRSAQVDEANALFLVLSSKIDVERELGIIKY